MCPAPPPNDCLTAFIKGYLIKTKQLILTFKDVLLGLYYYSLRKASVDNSLTRNTNALVLFYCMVVKHSKSLRHERRIRTKERKTQ